MKRCVIGIVALLLTGCSVYSEAQRSWSRTINGPQGQTQTEMQRGGER